MTCYRIKDWDSVFENRRTRELDGLRYVCWPTSQNSEAFNVLIRTNAGREALGIFGALVQWAARAPVRGTLVDHKGPLTPARFAARFSVPEADAVAAFELLASPLIGWLESADQAPTDRRPGADVVPTECRSTAEGTDGNGRTGVDRNGLERTGAVPGTRPTPTKPKPAGESNALGHPSVRPAETKPAVVDAVQQAENVRAALEALRIDGEALRGLASSATLTLDELRTTVDEITKQPGVRNPKRLLVAVLCERHGVKIEKGSKYRMGGDVTGLLAKFEAVRRSKLGGGE